MILKILFSIFTMTLFLFADESIIFTQAEQHYLKNKKEITACFSPKGLPLFGYKDGNYIGVIPDVIQLLEKNLPIPIQYIPVQTWEACVELSRKKKVDITGVIVTSPNQHTHLIPSKKVIDAYIGIATKINKPIFSHFSELKHQKMAFLKGQKSIRKYVQHLVPELNAIMVDTVQDGLELVAKGKVYGYIDDTYTLAYYILNMYSNELKIMERFNETPISGSVGVLENDPHLLSIINKSIELVDEKMIRNIIHNWIAVSVEKSFDYTLFIQLSSLLLVILLVSLYWVRRLLKEVKKRKKIEDKVKKFNENLEKEISSKIEEIHYKDAMLLEKTKLAAMGEMIGSIAHQWRRPLSTLHINIEMLEEDFKEKKIDQKFLEEFIKTNSQIIQYMSNTINDFQHFYKIDKEKRHFDVMDKIASVFDLKLNQLEENGIEIIKEGESFTVLGYPNEFQQVILNLISNAKDALIENNIKNPTIKIKVFSDTSKGYIQITDNAGGIKSTMIDKVFEPYFTTKEQNGGTGLGLYISKMIIEKNMQGTISASNVDKGVEVLITFNKEKYG